MSNTYNTNNALLPLIPLPLPLPHQPRRSTHMAPVPTILTTPPPPPPAQRRMWQVPQAPPLPQQQQQQISLDEWRERENRQRTVRLLMMFLMMLLLMDEDTNQSNERIQQQQQRLRGSSSSSSSSSSSFTMTTTTSGMDTPEQQLVDLAAMKEMRTLVQHRQQQDDTLRSVTMQHERYHYLIHGRNHDTDHVSNIHEWCTNQIDMVRDEFFMTTTTTAELDVESSSSSSMSNQMSDGGGGSNHRRSSVGSSSHNHDLSGEEDIIMDSDSLDNDKKVWHYPWNTTGFYRGSWTRIPEETNDTAVQVAVPAPTVGTTANNDKNVNIDLLVGADRKLDSSQGSEDLIVPSNNNTTPTLASMQQYDSDDRYVPHTPNRMDPAAQQHGIVMDAVQLEDEMLLLLQSRQQVAAVIPLPSGIRLQNFYSNYNRSRYRTTANITGVQTGGTVENAFKSNDPSSSTIPKLTNNVDRVSIGRTEALRHKVPLITLTRDDGRAAFQLFGKRVTGMKELSLVSGFLKLYDSTAAGYSTRKDVLLRVQGVLFHSIGRISLVSNVDKASMALIIDPSYHPKEESEPIHRPSHRRLQEAYQKVVSESDSVSDQSLVHVRNEALALYGHDQNDDPDTSKDENSASTDMSSEKGFASQLPHVLEDNTMDMTETIEDSQVENVWSNVVIPFPFVRDDVAGSIRNARTPASRTMPQREQALETNAAGCIFEITMDVSEVEWTIGAWRKLLLRRYVEAKMMDPTYQADGVDLIDIENEHQSNHRHVRPYASSRSNRHSKNSPAEALVMNMVGTIHSPNCNFHAHVNTTALRTDWDATTSKAINYSFYMMLVCLTQILILLRQLLHSQSQSVATRVSLLCVGWQAAIDALSCLGHIYLSLAVQPLFTAFASVAFFKLLIFCVIEMKYMAIMIQARNNINGGAQTSDALRRQVAMLHVRFYVGLVAIVLFLFYAPGKYRVYNILALYSFWVPQIVLNVITEAKTPLHKNYIYGMSATRLVAPLYIFGLRNNFLNEVYPESTTDPVMCQLLVLWVGFQAAILIAQSKYGARFMIPARFLPPKFDYSRPIPASMLPPGVLLDLPAPELMEDRTNDTVQPSSGLLKRGDGDAPNSTNDPHRELDLQQLPIRHQTADTTRNRLHRGGRGGIANTYHHHLGSNNGNKMITEDVSEFPQATPAPAPVMECSICYDDIDIRDRKKYMLAPCNHLYHSECLKQWMDVKMECPICRTQLPAL
jgi:Ring finger domain